MQTIICKCSGVLEEKKISQCLAAAKGKITLQLFLNKNYVVTFMGVEQNEQIFQQRGMSVWLKVHKVDLNVSEINTRCSWGLTTPHLTVSHNERNVECNGHLIFIPQIIN